MRRRTGVAALALSAMILAVGGLVGVAGVGASSPTPAWVPFRHVPGVLDVAGPRRDGSLVVAAAGRLFLLTQRGALVPFARGPDGYSTPEGPEPYIAVAENDIVSQSHCSFANDAVFAISPGPMPQVIEVSADGRARPLANLPKAAFLDGITFDGVGRFGHRLLVTALTHGHTTVYTVDCNGAVRTVTAHAPVMEGGIAVAPTSFGRFGGDLIAPDEKSGNVYAIFPNGATVTLVRSGLPSGQDTGVESTGFVPPGFGQGSVAYLADRFSRGNPHPGTDSLLQMTGSPLVQAGVRPGDLLVASEASATTIVVRCTSSSGSSSSCTVRDIAHGPVVTHGEGHIGFSSVPG